MIFTEDDARTESGLEAEVEGCAAAEKRGLVWARHVESEFGGSWLFDWFGCVSWLLSRGKRGKEGSKYV